MRCFECGYQCTPYDHTGIKPRGGPTWQCERCGWACKVSNEPKAVADWEQAMNMQVCVDDQLMHDDSWGDYDET